MSKLVKKIQNTAHQNELWKKGDKIVLGVSGGPDSMCLLNVFSVLQKKYSLKLAVAHINYNLREKDSQKDENLVKKTAEKLSLDFFSLTVSVQNSKNLEEKCRKIRYDFFEKIRIKQKFDSIAVAHNLDDQAETFLMRLIRGSGLQGLSAMKYRTEKIIRPLLGTSRKEILAYLKENKLHYRTDKTNLENIYLRNKIRNQLLPYLEKRFNPNIKKTLFVSSISIADDYDFIQKNIPTKKIAVLSAKKLLDFPSSILRGILRKELKKNKGDLRKINAKHIEEIIKILKSPKGKTQTIEFQGLKIEKKGDRVSVVSQK